MTVTDGVIDVTVEQPFYKYPWWPKPHPDDLGSVRNESTFPASGSYTGYLPRDIATITKCLASLIARVPPSPNVQLPPSDVPHPNWREHIETTSQHVADLGPDYAHQARALRQLADLAMNRRIIRNVSKTAGATFNLLLAEWGFPGTSPQLYFNIEVTQPSSPPPP